MADQYATRAAKVAVAQLAEAAGFDAVQHSSLDTLADLLLRYINEVGSASHGYAELAGRTESNPLDVLLALNDLGVSLSELQDYARVQEDIPFAQSIAAFPIKRKPSAVPTFQDKNEVPPSHIPSFLPAFPDKHTYVNTPAFAGHERDPHKRQQREAAARQDAVRAVVKLQARLAPDNKLLEKRAASAAGGAEEEGGVGGGPGAEGGAAPGSDAATAATNPFLAPTLWEHRLEAGSVGDDHPPGGAAPAAKAAPGPAGDGAAAPAAAEAVAELAGEWQQLVSTDSGEGTAAGAAAGAPLFISWDWKAHLQKKAQLAVSGGEQRDAYELAFDATAGTKHGRRAKRTERALAAQLEMGDPTRRRVDEILAARQEEADGGGADEEAVAAAAAAAAAEQEHI